MKELIILGGFIVIGIWLTGLMKKLDRFLEDNDWEDEDIHK